MKGRSFFLRDANFDTALNHWKNGTLDDMIKKRYGINIERYLKWKEKQGLRRR